jgi:2-keto-4-pentenoate hydratase/2-oxohepta-3-ene-1,7-dioic acid hydratase in catechol pathway
VLPAETTHVDAEAELAIIIGSQAKDVPRDDALDFVYGYTAANDVSARDLQFKDGQWFRGKGFDTFCPLLGDIVPVAEVGAAEDLRVTQRLNGELLQSESTRLLIFDVPSLVSFVSRVMTLVPGDVILTGTPKGVGYFREPKVALAPGDVVEVEVSGVGTLTNPVTGSSIPF